jgi:hypothetical protein
MATQEAGSKATPEAGSNATSLADLKQSYYEELAKTDWMAKSVSDRIGALVREYNADEQTRAHITKSLNLLTITTLGDKVRVYRFGMPVLEIDVWSRKDVIVKLAIDFIRTQKRVDVHALYQLVITMVLSNWDWIRNNIFNMLNIYIFERRLNDDQEKIFKCIFTSVLANIVMKAFFLGHDRQYANDGLYTLAITPGDCVDQFTYIAFRIIQKLGPIPLDRNLPVISLPAEVNLDDY